MNRRFVVLLALLVMMVLIAGCSSSMQKKVLVTKQLSPSSQEQVITANNDSISVRIPGGLITNAQALEISSIANPPAPFFAGLKPLASYEISLSATDHNTTFPKNATLEFVYDPASILAGVKAEDAFAVAYLNDDGEWTEVPAHIDTANHKAIVTTTHFSPWTLFGLLGDYEEVPSAGGHFVVYYEKNLNFKCFGTEIGSERLCAEGIGKVAETARSAYIGNLNAAGDHYSVPDMVHIYIVDKEESEMSPYTGNILLSKNLETVSSKSTGDQMQQADNRVKHEVAHELFHVVQNQYINVFSMKYRRWFMEASADYAADAIAMHDGTMGMDIRPDYLESSLYSTTGLHDYSTAHFLNYLVANGKGFKMMLDYINNHDASDGQETLLLLKQYVDMYGPQNYTLYTSDTTTKFEAAYRGFAKFYLFDKKSPIKIKSDFEAEIGSIPVLLKESEESKSVEMPTLFPYTAKAIAIRAEPGAQDARTITVNLHDDIGAIVLDGYLATGGDRASAKYVGSSKSKDQKISAAMGKDDVLYVLVIDIASPTNPSSRPFNVDVAGSMSGKSKSVSLDASKSVDLGQNTLTIEGSGSIKGPFEMAIVPTKTPNFLALNVINARGSTVPMTLTAKLDAQAQKEHWVDNSLQNQCKLTKDVSNFRYRITYQHPEKREEIVNDGNLEMRITQETLAKGEFRADVDLIWDYVDTYECSPGAGMQSQVRKGVSPGTNLIKISIQSGTWG